MVLMCVFHSCTTVLFAVYVFIYHGLCVGYMSELCKNGWTDRGAMCVGVGPRSHVLDGVHMGATWRMWLNDLCLAAVRAVTTVTWLNNSWAMLCLWQTDIFRDGKWKVDNSRATRHSKPRPVYLQSTQTVRHATYLCVYLLSFFAHVIRLVLQTTLSAMMHIVWVWCLCLSVCLSVCLSHCLLVRSSICLSVPGSYLTVMAILQLLQPLVAMLYSLLLCPDTTSVSFGPSVRGLMQFCSSSIELCTVCHLKERLHCSSHLNWTGERTVSSLDSSDVTVA